MVMIIRLSYGDLSDLLAS